MNNDLKSLSKAVAGMMQEDGVTCDNATTELVLAYVIEQRKRIERMQNLYLTNGEFKAAFNKIIYQLLTDQGG